eukprot:scpid38766/ scgid13186/ 
MLLHRIKKRKHRAKHRPQFTRPSSTDIFSKKYRKGYTKGKGVGSLLSWTSSSSSSSNAREKLGQDGTETDKLEIHTHARRWSFTTTNCTYFTSRLDKRSISYLCSCTQLSQQQYGHLQPISVTVD